MTADEYRRLSDAEKPVVAIVDGANVRHRESWWWCNALTESSYALRMLSLRSYDLVHFFSSHAWAYGHRREGLHEILWPWVRGVDFEDHSISRAHPLNTDDDPELARQLRDIIYRNLVDCRGGLRPTVYSSKQRANFDRKRSSASEQNEWLMRAEPV